MSNSRAGVSGVGTHDQSKPGYGSRLRDMAILPHERGDFIKLLPEQGDDVLVVQAHGLVQAVGGGLQDRKSVV